MLLQKSSNYAIILTGIQKKDMTRSSPAIRCAYQVAADVPIGGKTFGCRVARARSLDEATI